MNEKNEHTYVICAYKESQYIETCIKSLKRQSVKSIIKLATSTPCDYLRDLCQKYDIEYCVRQGKPGIADDWNYAYSQADTDYVTIAHQDDVYHPEYGKYVINGMKKTQDSIIVFTDYSELKNGKENKSGFNLYIKRSLLIPIRNNKKNDQKWRKRFIIRFGNAICCPSVTYNKRSIDNILLEQGRTELFRKHFRSNLDWEAWEWLSNQEGRFVFIPSILMSHRIHEDSETSAIIKDSERGAEDYEMFCRFWPAWISRLITSVYGKSEKGNEL